MSALDDLLGVIKTVKDEANDSGSFIVLGSVDPAYTSGRPKIKFDGETAVSTKAYPYLSSYTPAANHRVMLLKAGNSWVVLGRVI